MLENNKDEFVHSFVCNNATTPVILNVCTFDQVTQRKADIFFPTELGRQAFLLSVGCMMKVIRF